ncbi:MAG TPA: PKD domain-containing protein [Planctomycetota bacterium]|nr:PKD domain-containing protein [Planctomycetota bacterium]
MKFAYRIAFVLCVALFCAHAYCAGVLQVTGITSDQGEAFPTNVNVTFTATVTGANSVTTFDWDFGDGTTTTTMVNMASHTFTMEDDLITVTCTANNGIDPPDSDFEYFEAFRAPQPGDPQGANAGDPPQVNPDTGVTFTLNQCLGGFISGTLSVGTPAARDDATFSTDFGDDVVHGGSVLNHRYNDSGIYIMQTTASQNGSTIGLTRKTLAFSDFEIYGDNETDSGALDLPLAQKHLNNPKKKGMGFKVKGKFFFGTTMAHTTTTPTDTVSISWNMTLPAGFDPTSQVVTLAIGNVTDDITLSDKGQGIIDHPSPYKAVKIKFPHLKKGQTSPPNPTPTTVTVLMSSQDLTGQGFDTEGISPRQHQTSGMKGPFQRSVQVATRFAGIAFTGIAPINLSVSSDNSFGGISSR